MITYAITKFPCVLDTFVYDSLSYTNYQNGNLYMQENVMDKTGVARRLHDLRLRIGLSRETISQTTHISAATIKAWELGLRTIKEQSLAKYLSALKPLGCHADIKWVLYGDKAPAPQITSSQTIDDAVSLNKVIELLNLTSNLFYCLDTSESVLFIKKEWSHFLGGHNTLINDPITDINSDINIPNSSIDLKFQGLCSDEIYQKCHANYLKCLNGERVSFSYALNNQFSKNYTEVNMLYTPIFRHRDYKITGIFAFLSSNVGI